MNSAQQQYKITKATVTGDRFSLEIDIRATIIELVLFEDIEKPYITGSIAVMDDAGVYDGINFMGTERLNIIMASEDTSLSPVMERTFIMSGIDNIIKSTDNGTASVYVFSLIDEHALVSKSKKISRTVRGKVETEIQKICTTDLNKGVDVSYMSESAQSNMKVLIPYMNPLQACEWLRQRATTDTGLPFFLYASIHDDNIRLGNLEVMLEQEAWNAKLPYIYSPSNIIRAEDQSFAQKTMVIQSMKSSKVQNTMQLMMNGGVGSLYNNTNLNTGRTTSTKFNATEFLTELKERGIITKDQNVIDDAYTTTEGLTLSESNAQIYHTVTSSGTYDRYKSYHDEFDAGKFKLKMKNVAMRNMLYKNMFDVTVPGAGFIVSKASVGDIVKLNVLSDNSDPDSEDKFDKLRSGEFLIYNARHTFKDTRHDVAMTVCKIVRN